MRRIYGATFLALGRALWQLPRVLKALFLCVVVFPYWTFAAEVADTQAKEAELARLRERIHGVQATLDAARGEMSDLRQQLRAVEREIGRLVRSLRELAVDLRAQQDRLALLEKQRLHLQSELSSQQDSLKKQLRAAFIIGRQERLKILLNQRDPNQISRVLTYYDYFNRARATKIEAILGGLERLRSVEQVISRANQRLVAMQRRQEDEKAILESSQAQREAVMAALDSDIIEKSRRLEQMRANEERIQSLLASLREVLADIPPESGKRAAFAERKGRLPWPSKGRIVARFGAPRQVGKLRWDGVVIAAKEGNEVRAVSHGRVAFADWLRGFGLLTIIDHGDGYMSLYAYNQSLYTEAGDWVEAGEPIARVGTSGAQRRPGLYFEIRHAGRPVDPLHWCAPSADDRVGMIHPANSGILHSQSVPLTRPA